MKQNRNLEPIPNQYKAQAEPIIHEVGKLADKLLPFITELGDNVEIECGKCIVLIKQRGNKKMDKKLKKESRTFYEMQEDAWFDNNCQGNIEDYDGSEETNDQD